MNMNDIFVMDCSSNLGIKCGDVIKISKNGNGFVEASYQDEVIGASRSLNEGKIFDDSVESKVLFVNEHNRSIRVISESI